ncbi:hypothetical protein RRG08_017007 [Elysia crispata]|uniref:Uncharacterized protein n=1 Tax=Elysia crispata TaxID=231223 RepID=A0AAE0XZP1_9GAST|nr:hypothetical protein RRG08_017007 [Elysia crispata]
MDHYREPDAGSGRDFLGKADSDSDTEASRMVACPSVCSGDMDVDINRVKDEVDICYPDNIEICPLVPRAMSFDDVLPLDVKTSAQWRLVTINSAVYGQNPVGINPWCHRTLGLRVYDMGHHYTNSFYVSLSSF